MLSRKYPDPRFGSTSFMDELINIFLFYFFKKGCFIYCYVVTITVCQWMLAYAEKSASFSQNNSWRTNDFLMFRGRVYEDGSQCWLI